MSQEQNPPRFAPHDQPASAHFQPAAPYPVPGYQQCRFCGSVPAAAVTYRAHRGMILIMQFRRIDGPFCRDCGLAMFRRMTQDTLLQGWWGPLSMFITPVVLLINLLLRGSVARLEEPRPAPYGPSQRPMDPGK